MYIIRLSVSNLFFKKYLANFNEILIMRNIYSSLALIHSSSFLSAWSFPQISSQNLFDDIDDFQPDNSFYLLNQTVSCDRKGFIQNISKT